MRVSVVIITKNEEENIKRCLKSVYWADEKIVVDSGSSDSTVTQARKMGARVFKLRWKGYASQKNYAINKARGPWILSLDADEEIPRELADEIKRVVSSVKPADGYYINRRNFFYGKE
ncbi:MAG TPA: glycosyltransferase family 2 protein, partial [Candidatus Goldiibacteriota bacterium]|nr:glycosyltransferase family 2 protein [Candidatus Goldiibacteriota bacterium]